MNRRAMLRYEIPVDDVGHTLRLASHPRRVEMSGTSIDAQLRRQRAETPARRQGVRITDGVDWTQRPACACGCGELVRPDKTGRAWSKWLPNHHRRGEKP